MSSTFGATLFEFWLTSDAGLMMLTQPSGVALGWNLVGTVVKQRVEEEEANPCVE